MIAPVKYVEKSKLQCSPIDPWHFLIYRFTSLSSIKMPVPNGVKIRSFLL